MPFSRFAQGFETRTGDRFDWGEWVPTGEPGAIVVAMHGLGSRLEHFAPLGERLEAVGVVTAAWNLRGQGLDPVERRRGASLEVDQLLRDLDDFLTIIRDAHPGIPIFLAGDSMGAQLAILAATTRGEWLAGTLLYVPVVALRQRTPEWVRALLGGVGAILPWLRLSPKWFVDRGPETIPLTRVPERQRELDEAPYRLRQFSLRFLSDMGELIARTEKAGPRIGIPVAVFSVGVDLFISSEQSAAFVADLATHLATHFHYPEAYHDLLHDPDRAQVIDDTVGWLEARLA